MIQIPSEKRQRENSLVITWSYAQEIPFHRKYAGAGDRYDLHGFNKT